MNKELKNNILESFESVTKDLSELETTSNFVYYTTQIAGYNSCLNSFSSLLKNITENDSDVQSLVTVLSKKLTNFIFSFKNRNLSFFQSIPSSETQEEFYNQSIVIVNNILAYGLVKGKKPIVDDNPIYEVFGISHQFPEMLEEFRNCLLLLYRNIILQTLFIPLHDISLLPINHSNRNLDENEFDTNKLFENIFVIESESGMKQGTAFYLKNVGIITCDHCIREEETNIILNDLTIYNGNRFNEKIAVKVIKSNVDLDIALIELPDIFKEKSGLEIGSSLGLQQLQKIGVAGFPNYNFGDNGIFSPGLIVGFRNYSGKKHLLVNCPLISGNSGGPAFDTNSKVIGLAVTGADKMSRANETEKHGIIPIEAIFEI
jgi:S1-C subfamily serine protease